MLALVFVRKVLDLCFSKRELSYLDDLMPEWKKKNLDDASKKIEEVYLNGILKCTHENKHKDACVDCKCLWRGRVSCRNQRLCSVQRRKILFRFPWRAASLFRPPKHMTPGEYAHMHTYAHLHGQKGHQMIGVVRL